ncbi:endo alpha-1,4 polygalactosaminidase [Deinococcus sp. JMULE3]|uniref:endo alpha-1,4 polygalactosaminidase n=1 Tax=Deinococcus sp. JMULE3 TaxID=2518341 RepID=UPI0020C62E90|nr:endo alpha-1,4 polygalactosaminidase [Deinococcus sp. JMULE3]
MKAAPLSAALTTLLLLAACGQTPSAPTTAKAPSTQVPSTQAPATSIEAERGQLDTEQLQGQAAIDPRTGSGVLINDATASGGQAVKLSATGSAVRFPMPTGTTGSYAVTLRARGVSSGGVAPSVSLRVNGTEKARVSLTSTSYASVSLGTQALQAGDTVRVVMLNGDSTGTRAAVIDYLDITSATPVATQPAPAPAPTPTPTPTPTTGIKLPPTGLMGWDWQIGASSDSAVSVPAGAKLIDLDGFNTSAAKVAELKSKGYYTVCYINAGSWESYRPDAAKYPDYLKIQQDPDWAGEYFLDVTDVFKSGSALAPILQARFKMCKDKGFDALEPDNLQNDENVSGGKITTQQQIDFNGWVADQAHAAGLAVFQKNGPDKILLKDRTGKMMVEKFDGILNEECQQYSECGPLAEYTKRGKLALNVEYSTTLNCATYTSLGVSAMKRDLGLVSPSMSGYKRQSCN